MFHAVCALAILGYASATIRQERFQYQLRDPAGEVNDFDGFIAYDDQLSNLPGLVLHHQFFGEGANEDYYATFWAQQGFFVIAADIYGVGIRPDNTDDAIGNLTFLQSQPELYRGRLEQTFELLFTFPQVSRDRGGAAMGFCLGGDSVFELARVKIPELKAIFAFHPTTNGVLGQIAPDLNNVIPSDVWVQAHKGTLDTEASNGDFLQLQADLDAARVAHYTTVIYGDSVEHGFSLPFEDAYDQAAANQGMQSVAYVLSKVFPGTFSPFLRGEMEVIAPEHAKHTMKDWAHLSHHARHN